MNYCTFCGKPLASGTIRHNEFIDCHLLCFQNRGEIMKDKQKPVAAMEAAKKWEPIKDLVASLRPASLAAAVTFSEAGVHVQLTIPWADVPPALLPKEG